MMTVKQVIKEMNESFGLSGDRVAILTQNKPETYGDGNIYRPDAYTSIPNRGHIVLIGDAIRPEAGAMATLGREVTFSLQAASHAIDYYDLSEGKVRMAVISTKDVYLYWKD